MTCICAIAVYAGHELADITLYREWEMKDLFVEASARMALFSHCRNKTGISRKTIYIRRKNHAENRR